MSVVATKFKCDRDNVEVDNAGADLPAGWGYVGIGGGGLMPNSVNLCPACLDAFVTFMGGMFRLQSTAPQTPAPDGSEALAGSPVAQPVAAR